MWKIRHEPRMYEQLKMDFFEPKREAVAQRPVEVNISAGGILLLALLGMLNYLSNPEGSGIEGRENTNASESTQPSANSEA
jgi:hypothetical protein